MPKNNKLEPVVLPMDLRFGDQPTTEFKNNLDAIRVELLDAPSVEQLRSYLPQFCEATWSRGPRSNDNMTLREKDKIIKDAFMGKTLPTALETINLNFRISGISLQEVTHLIRYRNASFSADCSGDKWWTDKDALVPNSIQNSNSDIKDYSATEDFHMRYKNLVSACKQLYCDMIDSKQISIMDARYILPRCLSTYYYVRMTLKDAIHFIKQRIDKQIQPETDNVIAYQMYIEILRQYPYAAGMVDIHQPSYFYVNTARTGKATNLYFPDADSDKFEWNEHDFIYQCERSEMNGTDDVKDNRFESHLYQAEQSIALAEKLGQERLERDYKLDEIK